MEIMDPKSGQKKRKKEKDNLKEEKGKADEKVIEEAGQSRETGASGGFLFLAYGRLGTWEERLGNI